MTPLDVVVHVETVETDELRTRAEAGDRESINDLAYAAIASGIATPEIEARVVATDEASSRGLWQALKNLITGTRMNETRRYRDHLRWPLFLLGCPNVKDATTEVVFSKAIAEGQPWKVKLFGAGFEQATTLTITDTITATATPGQYRILFTGSDVDVIEFDLVRGGNVVSRGRRVEVLKGTTVIGWIDLAQPPAWAQPTAKLISLDYRHTDPTSRQAWRQDKLYSQLSNLVFAMEMTPVEIGPTLSYQTSTTVTLQAQLPGGARWSVARPERCAGMLLFPEP